MTHRETRVLFSQLVCQLGEAVRLKTWSYGTVEMAFDEWTVHSDRVYIDKLTGERRQGIDRVHQPKGFIRKVWPWNVLIYINGVYVSDGNHPVWKELDQMAHILHKDLNFGDEFHDSNHLSFGELK